jgi:hypothetical protein
MQSSIILSTSRRSRLRWLRYRSRSSTTARLSPPSWSRASLDPGLRAARARPRTRPTHSVPWPGGGSTFVRRTMSSPRKQTSGAKMRRTRSRGWIFRGAMAVTRLPRTYPLLALRKRTRSLLVAGDGMISFLPASSTFRGDLNHSLVFEEHVVKMIKSLRGILGELLPD